MDEEIPGKEWSIRSPPPWLGTPYPREKDLNPLVDQEILDFILQQRLRMYDIPVMHKVTG
jgi:hypothetical protein